MYYNEDIIVMYEKFCVNLINIIYAKKVLIDL